MNFYSIILFFKDWIALVFKYNCLYIIKKVNELFLDIKAKGCQMTAFYF